MSQRRLPVYLLLDCSESMIGESIQAVEKGVESLLSQLRADPHALETAYVSIITFHRTAQQVVPLTEVSAVRPPRLAVRPGTSLGAALTTLRDCIQREVRRTTPDMKGDYRPIVFLLTDGQPTDGSGIVREAITWLTTPKIANVYAIGCGEDVDYETLRRVADVVFRLDEVGPETLRKLFIWLTASVQQASRGVAEGEARDGIDLTKKPTEVALYKEGTTASLDQPRQVFLKARCSRLRRSYLMRFRLHDEHPVYVPVRSHELESGFEEGGGYESSSINSSQLAGCPPCPYCENPGAAVCECGTLMCTPAESPVEVLCPGCLVKNTFSGGGEGFAIEQSPG
jgi:uncharacterized protein YegL